MATIKDIARLSGYSIGTVSRVINNHPDVSEAARQKVEEVIRQTGFQPNSNAKYLKQASFSAVTILIKGTKNIFLETILEDIQELMRNHGEAVSVVFLDELANEVETAVQLCAERKPKGLIFLGANPDYLKKSFGSITVPAVLVTGDAKGLGFENLSSFCTDDFKAAGEAVGYLIEAGHSKIGIVGGRGDREHGNVGADRLSGAIEKLAQNNISFDMDKNYEPALFSAESGYKAAGKLLEKNRDITAVFALSDIVAIGVMRAAGDRGLKVPDDLSVIGFDGIEYSRYSVPRLTTVKQSSSQLAVRSVEDLLMRLSYTRPAVHEKVPFMIIEQESVKKIKK